MRMMNPSMMVSILDLVFPERAAAGIDFRPGILRYLYSKEAVQGAPEVGSTHQGAPGPPSAPWWVLLPSSSPPSASLAHWMSSGPQKILQDIDFL